MPDDITRAVRARDDVARSLRAGPGAGRQDAAASARIHAYLDELQTRQRYPFYRALKHPLYPILRKIERIDEHVAIAQAAPAAGRGGGRRRGRGGGLCTSRITRATPTTSSNRWCSTTTGCDRR